MSLLWHLPNSGSCDVSKLTDEQKNCTVWQPYSANGLLTFSYRAIRDPQNEESWQHMCAGVTTMNWEGETVFFIIDPHSKGKNLE